MDDQEDVLKSDKSVVALFRVDKAKQRKWVPRPVSENGMDWSLLDWALSAAYGNPRHGVPEDPFDCLMYVMLTRKTPIDAGRRVFERLKTRHRTWVELLTLERSALIQELAGTGLEETRADDLTLAVDRVVEEFGAPTLERLRKWPNQKCISFLTSMRGVGPKTARCVLMYSLGRSVFPADTHCIRVLARLGVIPEGTEHDRAQALLDHIVPRRFSYNLHVNLVAHGQQVCSAEDPSCSVCSIRKMCSHYRVLCRSGVRNDGRPIAIDVFSGAGGASLGLLQAGYQVVGAIDNDEWACKTFLVNHPEMDSQQVKCADLRTVDDLTLKSLAGSREVDLLFGGPPCQGFSLIGKRVRGLTDKRRYVDDPRNSLYREFVRVAQILKPRIVVMENVLGIASFRAGLYRDMVLSGLDEVGYQTAFTVIDTFNFGVSQHRLRTLFLGASREGFGDMAPDVVSKILSALDETSDPGPALREAIGDLPSLQQDDGCEVMKRSCSRGELPAFAVEMGASGGLVFNHVSRPLNERDRSLYALLLPGEDGHDAVSKHGARHLMVYRDDIFQDKYRRLDYDKPGPVVMAHMAKDGHMFIHPDQHRSLTVREAARIQSFPDDFLFCGPRTHQFRQVGNAFPPRAARILGEAVVRALRDTGSSNGSTEVR